MHGGVKLVYILKDCNVILLAKETFQFTHFTLSIQSVNNSHNERYLIRDATTMMMLADAVDAYVRYDDTR